jgi:hypothetical protein
MGVSIFIENAAASHAPTRVGVGIAGKPLRLAGFDLFPAPA